MGADPMDDCDTHNPVNPVNYVSENYISNFSIFISPQSLMMATFLTNGSEAECAASAAYGARLGYAAADFTAADHRRAIPRQARL